jgi:hypothetical protein
VKKASVKAKHTTKAAVKTAVAKVARVAGQKAPNARKNAPKSGALKVTRTKGKLNGQSKAPRTEVANPVDVSDGAMLPAVDLETSHEPIRGGYHDRANHSRSDVQLQMQHTRTLRGPERRPTMRGH